jgi:serine/threonine-protein kinase HipA
MEGIGKRTIIRTLSLLEKEKRIETVGQSSATKYVFSDSYHQEFNEKLYLYQNQICIGYLGFDYEQYFFVYDSAYLLSSKYISVFQMPISTTTYAQTRCFVDFEELLPEGIDKKILIEKTGNATEFFLLANNNYSRNDLIFSQKELSFGRVIKDEKSLFPHEYMNEEAIKEVRTISLSGYQHKLQVTLKNGTIQVPKEDEEVVKMNWVLMCLKVDFLNVKKTKSTTTSSNILTDTKATSFNEKSSLVIWV